MISMKSRRGDFFQVVLIPIRITGEQAEKFLKRNDFANFNSSNVSYNFSRILDTSI
jgi:hypothetical protein